MSIRRGAAAPAAGTFVASALIAYNTGAVDTSTEGHFVWDDPVQVVGADVEIDTNGDILINTAGRYTITFSLAGLPTSDARGYCQVKKTNVGTALPAMSLLGTGNDPETIYGPWSANPPNLRPIVTLVMPEDEYDAGNIIRLTPEGQQLSAGSVTFPDGQCVVYVRRNA